MPEISVIVPIYKAEAYLHRCVDSILAQTFTDFELILVDDGSPDRCGVICDEYAQKDSRVRVIHKPNGGVSSARNAGIDAAKGNYITFVDSDDYVNERYLTDLYKPLYNLVVSGYTCLDEMGNIGDTIRWNVFEIDRIASENISEVLKANGQKWMGFCWSKLFDANIIKSHSMAFDNRMHYGEDYVFVVQYLVNCNSLCILNSANYMYVRHSIASLSTTNDITYFDNFIKTEKVVAAEIETAFNIEFPISSDESIARSFASSIGYITANPDFSFWKKYSILKYLYKNKYFKLALADVPTYFQGTSRIYQLTIRLRSPFLLLAALSIRSKLKYKRKYQLDEQLV